MRGADAQRHIGCSVQAMTAAGYVRSAGSLPSKLRHAALRRRHRWRNNGETSIPWIGISERAAATQL